MKRFRTFIVFIISKNPLMAFISCALGVLAIFFSAGLYSLSAYLILLTALKPAFEAIMLPVVGVRFFGIGRAAFRYIERLSSHDTTFRVLRDLRVHTYKRMEARLPDFKNHSKKGNFVSKIISDVENLQEAFLRIVYPYMVAIIIMITGSIGLAFLNPYLAFGFFGVYFIAAFVVPYFLGFMARGNFSISNEIKQEMYSEFIEFSYGITEIISNGREEYWENRLDRIFENDLEASKKSSSQGAAANAFSLFFPGFSMWVCLIISCWLVSNNILAKELIAIAPLASSALFEAVAPLLYAASRFEKTESSINRLFEDSCEESLTLKNWKDISSKNSVEKINKFNGLSKIQGGEAIELKNVSFSYKNGHEIINNFNMQLKKGKITALLGESGAGKSTIVNLLLGFVEGYNGLIEIDGTDIKAFTQDELLSLFSVVDQKPFFFNISIRENLKIASSETCDEEIFNALKKANIYDFVMKSSNGLDTQMGEMGTCVSGGELQRLSIARAYLKNAPFYIFDEPTACLDAINEKCIMQLIKELSKDKAVLLITHRAVMLDQMDEIIMLGQHYK